MDTDDDTLRRLAQASTSLDQQAEDALYARDAAIADALRAGRSATQVGRAVSLDRTQCYRIEREWDARYEEYRRRRATRAT